MADLGPNIYPDWHKGSVPSVEEWQRLFSLKLDNDRLISELANALAGASSTDMSALLAALIPDVTAGITASGDIITKAALAAALAGYQTSGNYQPAGNYATQSALQNLATLLSNETERAQSAEAALQTGYRLINRQAWTTGGSYTYTPTSGTRAIIVRLCGGGGGGSGGAGAGPGWLIDGFGGNGGTTAESNILTVPSAPVAVTVGSGGAGTNGPSGGNGGVSSFGSLISCPGGPGGRNTVVFPAGAVSGAPGGFAPPAAGNFLWQSLGGPGSPFCSYQGMNCGSAGGSSFFGSGAAWTGDGIAGAAGKNPGSGGSAGTTNQTTAPVPGGNGADGIVIIEEYC